MFSAPNSKCPRRSQDIDREIMHTRCSACLSRDLTSGGGFLSFSVEYIWSKTGDNGNAMLPKKVRISKKPAKRFLYRSLWAQIFEKRFQTFQKPRNKLSFPVFPIAAVRVILDRLISDGYKSCRGLRILSRQALLCNFWHALGGDFEHSVLRSASLSPLCPLIQRL